MLVRRRRLVVKKYWARGEVRHLDQMWRGAVYVIQLLPQGVAREWAAGTQRTWIGAGEQPRIHRRR